MERKVTSLKCELRSVKYKVWSVQSIVECGVWSGKCRVGSVECRVWSEDSKV